MSTDLFLYKKRVNKMGTSDKKVIVYYFMYILYRFLLYGIIFRDIWEILNVIWDILIDIYIINNFVLLIFLIAYVAQPNVGKITKK